MDELDAILNDLQTIAKDVGFDVPKSNVGASSSPASTADTGFDSASDSYNYSTVKRAPPKTPQVPQPPEPELGTDNFGLDKILASLDQLDGGGGAQQKLSEISAPPPPTPPKVKPMPPTRPRPSPKPSSFSQNGPIIKAEPVQSSPAPPPPPPPAQHKQSTLERVKPPPPATPPRTDTISRYGSR